MLDATIQTEKVEVEVVIMASLSQRKHYGVAITAVPSITKATLMLLGGSLLAKGKIWMSPCMKGEAD